MKKENGILLASLRKNLKELEAKRKRCGAIWTKIFEANRGKSPAVPDRWYKSQAIGNRLFSQICDIKDKIHLLETNENYRQVNKYEESRAIREANVTSTTYERSLKAIAKQIDARFKNR